MRIALVDSLEYCNGISCCRLPTSISTLTEKAVRKRGSRGRVSWTKEISLEAPGSQVTNTTMIEARVLDKPMAVDYYQAMQTVERQLALPEDQMAQPPSLGELIALVDSLRDGSLTMAQTEVVWTLRSGLTRLAKEEESRDGNAQKWPIAIEKG